MKRNKLSYLYIVVAFLSLNACKKGDDLYVDPSVPLKVTPQSIMTSLQVNSFMNIEGDLARVSSILDQQMAGAAAQYLSLQNYDLSESDYNNHWAGLYANTMENAKIMMDTYTDKSPYYGGIARIIMAMNMGVATDLWGDVPYSQAFQANTGNFAPAYDPQEQVIQSIQTLLDEAIVELSKSQSDNAILPGADDLIYEGDVSKWIKAAWTLKARYANRLSLKDPSGSATNVLNYLAKGITLAADNMEAKHSESGNEQNQWGAYENSRGGNMVANKVFVDALKSNNDPRLGFYFSKDENGQYTGADITKDVINTEASIIGSYFDVGANYALVTSYEARFLEAEAKARLGQDASAALNAGIKQSVSYVTAGANGGGLIAIYTPVTATKTAVLTEKWKAMFGTIEGYNDVRRTNVPALTPRPQSAGAVRSYIPKRLPTPQVERTGNAQNAKPIELDVPVWWSIN